MRLRYTDAVITTIRRRNQFFYEFFNMAVFISYTGVIALLSSFIFFTHNDLYFNSISISIKISFFLWLFCLYFYLISELRFRIVQLAKIKENTKLLNNITLLISFFLSTISILFI
ncbi:MAG: hypothetical protein LBT02_00325 [Rickettsiales bacterium]|nr:hypothetical protein [Rickettsiales bacterium]